MQNALSKQWITTTIGSTLVNGRVLGQYQYAWELDLCIGLSNEIYMYFAT